jgi:hypothetical protein
MEKIPFNRLPFIAKLAIIVTFFNTWVMFEEFVIDRFGWWQYLPFYKKGIFCIWDVFTLFILTFFIFELKMRKFCPKADCMVCHK